MKAYGFREASCAHPRARGLVRARGPTAWIALHLHLLHPAHPAHPSSTFTYAWVCMGPSSRPHHDEAVHQKDPHLVCVPGSGRQNA